MTLFARLRARDAGLGALRRAGRAAIVMPAMFAIADKVIGSPTIATFAAFGSLATLLFVDFGGTMRERLAAQASLVVAGSMLVCLGTIASRSAWLAVVVTVPVAFAVLFAGVVSSALASATTSLLVGFVLPVTTPGPLGTVPDRLAGWSLAGAASLVAITVLWPAPTREPLRAATASACQLLAHRLRIEVDCIRTGLDPARLAAHDAAVAEAGAAVAALRTSFYGMAYRPTGLATAARTLVRLVDEVVWLDTIVSRSPLDRIGPPTEHTVCAVKLAAADLLDRSAGLLETVRGDPGELAAGLRRLELTRAEMERTAVAALPARLPRESSALGHHDEFVNSLEASFRAQEMSFAVSAIASNIALTVAARQRSWWQQLLGHRPDGAGSSLASAQERAGAHIERHSVWLHNSVRGAAAVGLAVLVAELTGVQHSFWVVFGTLAVLRSSAVNTGQNAWRGLLGTLAGFAIGGGLVAAIGTHPSVYWALLPIAVLFAGLAPAAISFAAGQAGFTMVLLILYNIVAPSGWRVGLVRIEDVAIGGAVSVVVGTMFWPRGAGSALGQAIGEALTDSAQFLRQAIEYGVTRCDDRVPASHTPDTERRRAAAAARRLDDAFRQFLAERGTKRLPLADVTMLLTGVAVLRLTADAVLDLWAHDDGATAGDRTAARHEILDAGLALTNWYTSTARAIAGSGDVPDQVSDDGLAGNRLVRAVQHDLGGEDGRGTAVAVKMIWTADHIDAVRRLQAGLREPALAAAAAQQATSVRLVIPPRR